MSDQHIQAAKDGYAAFAKGDAEGAMANISDDIEWVVPGESGVSGTHRGKQEVGALWGKLAEKGFKSEPQHWFSDGDKVVVLTSVTADGNTYDAADVLTYDSDGNLVKFQSAGDTLAMSKIFPA